MSEQVFSREYASENDLRSAYQMGVATVLQYGIPVRHGIERHAAEDELPEPDEHVLHLPVGFVENIEPKMVPAFSLEDELVLITQKPDDANDRLLYLMNRPDDTSDIARLGPPSGNMRHWGAFIKPVSASITTVENGQTRSSNTVLEDPLYPAHTAILNSFLRRLAGQTPADVIAARHDIASFTPEQKRQWYHERQQNKELGLAIRATPEQRAEVHQKIGQLAWQWGEVSEPDADTTVSQLTLSAERLRERTPQAIRLLRATGAFRVTASDTGIVTTQWELANQPTAATRSVVVPAMHHSEHAIVSTTAVANQDAQEKINGLGNLEAQALLKIAESLQQGVSEMEMAALQWTEEDSRPQALAGVLYGRQ